jgi:16S rRNA (guanine(1405)-N(7))-methyltransferase
VLKVLYVLRFTFYVLRFTFYASRITRQDKDRIGMSDRYRTQLDSLVKSIVESSKYRRVSAELIEHIGLRELAARRNFKDAVKATKNKLHQVGGAFLDSNLPYDTWTAELADAAQANDQEQLRRTCVAIMQRHASTRERVRLLDTFYTTIFAGLPPIRSVLDLGCGFHPLALPWMQLERDVAYYACDIFADMMAFLNSFFRLIDVHGQAQVCDLAAAPPTQPVDLALAFKLLPTLEQLDKNAGFQLLQAINATYMLVSFPVRSLGGHNKGMAEQYEHRFQQLIQAQGWAFERFEFATELVFRFRK